MKTLDHTPVGRTWVTRVSGDADTVAAETADYEGRRQVGAGDATVAALALETPSPGGVARTMDETPYFFQVAPRGGPGTGDVVGRYRLLKPLGDGAFGKVFLAEHTELPAQKVAIKIMDIEVARRRRVEQELLMLASASHPHIVQLTDHGVAEGWAWIAMPYYSGETLSAVLERGVLSPRAAYDIFTPIAAAVAALHAAGLRHQDIKPDNLFLAQYGNEKHPILLDLGVATAKESAFVAGTPLFAAPEQLRALAGQKGRSQLGEKMDVYGLATTLLRAIAGPSVVSQARTEGDTVPEAESVFRDLEAMAAERERDPLPRSAWPEVTGAARAELVARLRSWLAIDPAKRPSMSEMAEGLDVLLQPEREAQRRSERRHLRRNLALGVVTAVLAFVLVLGVFYRDKLTLAAQIQDLQGKHTLTFNTLSDCQAGNTTLLLKQQSTEKALREQAESTSAAASALAAEKEAHGQTGAELRAKTFEAERSAKEAEDLRQKLATAVSESEQRRAALLLATDALNKASEELTATRAQLAAALGDVKTATDALEKAKAEAATQKTLAESAKKALEQREKDLADAKAELESARKKLQAKTEEAAAEAAKASTLLADLSKCAARAAATPTAQPCPTPAAPPAPAPAPAPAPPP